VTIRRTSADDNGKSYNETSSRRLHLKVPSNANLDIDVFSSPVTVTGVSGKHRFHLVLGGPCT
jgi:hypothetical protein